MLCAVTVTPRGEERGILPVAGPVIDWQCAKVNDFCTLRAVFAYEHVRQ
jgi:hypothetical protein